MQKLGTESAVGSVIPPSYITAYNPCYITAGSLRRLQSAPEKPNRVRVGKPNNIGSWCVIWP